MELLLAKRSTETLKQAANLAMASNDDNADLALHAILTALEGRMPEVDYINFCNGLLESF